MHYFRAYGQLLASTFPLLELPPSKDGASGEPDWIIRPACSIDSPTDTTWRMLWRHDNGEPWAAVGTGGGRLVFRFTHYCDFGLDGATISVATRAFTSHSTVEHLLLDQVLPLALAARGHTVLHASAVVDDHGRAILFCGPAGSGKSTLAAACATCGLSVAADDGVLVTRDEQPMAVPAYAGLRLWRDSAEALEYAARTGRLVAEYSSKVRISLAPSAPDRRFEILGVYVLDRGDRVTFERLTGHEALLAVIRHAYRMDLVDRLALGAQVDELRRLVLRVPTWRLRIPRDLGAVRSVAAAVAGHA